MLQHPEHPWMLANIDREICADPDVQILECKTAGLNGARLWRDGVPEYVQLQVMHQLAVTGKQAADVVVLICGQELQIHRIERDEAMIARLIELEGRFWSLVQAGIEPSADGTDSADLALRCLYPQDSGNVVDWRDDAGKGALFGDLLDIRSQITCLTGQENRIRQTIQQAMGDASVALLETGTVTWKKAGDRTTLDTARLLQ